MNKIIEANKIILKELIQFLDSLNASQYHTKCVELENNSISQHTRHIIEMYQCLISGYKIGVVDYDKRKRNCKIETDIEFAKDSISTFLHSLEKEDKSILLVQEVLNEPIQIESNYYRELVYNYEHCIHHKALIKVACIPFENINLDPKFGVAPSTIKFAKDVYC